MSTSAPRTATSKWNITSSCAATTGFTLSTSERLGRSFNLLLGLLSQLKTLRISLFNLLGLMVRERFSSSLSTLVLMLLQGYDSIPAEILDLKAKKPVEWDDEDDALWKPPKVPNPSYKGPWKRKKIKNPIQRKVEDSMD